MRLPLAAVLRGILFLLRLRLEDPLACHARLLRRSARNYRDAPRIGAAKTVTKRCLCELNSGWYATLTRCGDSVRRFRRACLPERLEGREFVRFNVKHAIQLCDSQQVVHTGARLHEL